MKLKKPLENRKGILFIGGCNSLGLAKKYSTPLYVYDENKIRENCRRLFNAFNKNYEKFKLYYAIKANNNLAILKVIQSEGLGADCSCPEEIMLAKDAGFPKEKTLYSGVYHKDSELEFALKEGIAINLEDVSQIERLCRIGVPEFISFRINPGMGKGGFKQLVFAGPDAKFGVIERDVLEAYKKAKDYGVKRFGIHMMTGSNVLDPDYFIEVTEKLLDIAGNVSKELGIEFEFIDIGGGFGVPYKPEEKELDIESVAEKVVDKFKSKIEEHNLGEPYLMIEPGRFIVCDSGIILSTIHSIKDGYKKFLGIDAGMNILLRPMLYGAYHEMFIADKLDETKTEKVNVCGQICENTDILAKDRILPAAKERDILAILNAGAYGYSMSSDYNTRPRAAEVLVNNGKDELIRRREDYSDIKKDMVVPERLK